MVAGISLWVLGGGNHGVEPLPRTEIQLHMGKTYVLKLGVVCYFSKVDKYLENQKQVFNVVQSKKGERCLYLEDIPCFLSLFVFGYSWCNITLLPPEYGQKT
jgi:hypothetical protein